jgi:hypothetical protein
LVINIWTVQTNYGDTLQAVFDAIF